ncbi:MAG: HAMP domain-containing protein [Nitrospirae bacterium]|nr:HAMP domain-containing protein [Nitrospirota bacterium]
MQKRIIVSTLLSLAVLLATLGLVSHLSIRDSINRSLDDRLRLANIISNYTDALLQGNITRLYDLSLAGAIDIRDGNWEPEKKAIRTAYQYSIFTDGIFLLDHQGNIVLNYPPGRQKENLMAVPYVKKAFEEKRAVISDVYTMPETQKRTIFALVPLRDKNDSIIGLAGGEINPTTYMLSSVIKAIPAEAGTWIELIDSKGTVIASNKPSRLFTCSDHDRFLNNLVMTKKTAVATCHRCHEDAQSPEDAVSKKTTDMLAFSPLSETLWGVAVREPEEVVFAPSKELQKKFLLLGFISMGSALIAAIGISSSIVKPIKSLIAATKRIAEGNLKEPVKVVSANEIGLLSENFEAMRIGLSESHDRIERHNEELESRVAERTEELMRHKRRLASLLEKIITAQEEERKRVARELHDETSQSLAALGMSIEIADIAIGEGRLPVGGMTELKGKVEHVLDGINMLIQDLRPLILDDLGFESAIRWLLEKHIGEKGISYSLNITDRFRTAILSYTQSKRAELMLFRVIQEAIINISKYAGAKEVFVFMESANSNILITIADDGVGFDVNAVTFLGDRDESIGFGILGMRERVSLLDGRLTICSRLAEGTEISVIIPWTG